MWVYLLWSRLKTSTWGADYNHYIAPPNRNFSGLSGRAENTPRMWKENGSTHDNNASESHKIITLYVLWLLLLRTALLLWDNNAQWFYQKIHHIYLPPCQKLTHPVSKYVWGMFPELCRKALWSCSCAPPFVLVKIKS